MGTLSQYHTQFLEFGSETLTRDFKKAKQHIQSRVQQKKPKNCPPTVDPKFLLKLEAGKVHRFFFFLHLTFNFCFSLIQITCQNFRS